MSMNRTSFAGGFESLSADISSIIESVEAEQEIFVEFRCYLYRVFPLIMELQFAKNPPQNAKEIVESISMNVNLAKDLVGECHKKNPSVSDSELVKIIARLEGVIKDIGECLCSIPSGTFEGATYVENAVRSLSDELQKVHFEPQIQSPESLTSPREFDLYPVDDEESASTESSPVFSMPHLIDIHKITNQISQLQHENRDKSMETLPHVANYIEPMYDAFFCPLTKQIMDDPVTIENGVTYDRKAITEWFETFGHRDDMICPTTGMKLTSKVLSTNVSLKTTIEEWKERNETARIKVARTSLSLASSDSMILEAIIDLQHLCKRRRYNKDKALSVGILPLVIRLLAYLDKDVRCEALELLRQLAEEDDEVKEMIANTMDAWALIELISSSHQEIRHASLLLLVELSRTQALSEKIGSATGAILMLIRVKSDHNVDSFASEKADEILKSLETFPDNVKRMAEYGFLEPLLNHLTEGPEEFQMEMTCYLGELILNNDGKTYVAEKASPSLIQMVQSANTVLRNAAFKALVQISTHHPNGRILVEAGIVEIMAEEMFTREINDQQMDSKKEAAAILANVLESEVELDGIKVTTLGHGISSDYVVYNIMYMLKNSTLGALNIDLIRILLCLTKSPKSMDTIVDVVNEREASYTLIELINSPHEELRIAVIKLLISLTPHVGNTLAERLCKTGGQPQSLIECPDKTNHITEKQAVSAKFLATLPQQNLTLNLALLNNNVVPVILRTISAIRRNGTITSRHTTVYLEGLVGILVRFTTTLYEPQIMYLARTHNLTLVFTELLISKSSDEVQRLSAIGLGNLSSESVNLSRPPQVKKSKSKKRFYLPNFLSYRSLDTRKTTILCPVHRGVCSHETTFCLIDANAVERLLVCFDHDNDEVVEASMEAICTLLDDKVDVVKSVSLLSDMNAIQYIFNVLKEHKQEGLWQKSLWMIEKFIVTGGNKSVPDISQDRLLPASLVSVFENGNDSMKQVAENILRHLNRMPTPSTTYYSM
ncbi:putative U-box domain-containing protein 42 [Hibiscus syriacus]|uniref:putative U-box domain-containing protein 42 n=1 Tax=Hibiscus syriacus TaxID=106335 RepID=UPI0019243B27|nr:putative U-box domain-containing protein 42 [Hibiscus syriacus]